MRALLLALTAATLAPVASAQVSFAPFVGYDERGEAPMVGLAVEAGVPLYGSPVAPSARALVEYVFADADLDVVHVNLDAVARFGAGYGGGLAPYGKGGLTLTLVAPEFEDSVTELGLNVGGGVEVSRFFVEGEYAFGEFDGLRGRVGYRF